MLLELRYVHGIWIVICTLMFQELDPERICYHILRCAVENPNMVATRIAKFARPYMDEHRLNPDLTIFRYIEVFFS